MDTNCVILLEHISKLFIYVIKNAVAIVHVIMIPCILRIFYKNQRPDATQLLVGYTNVYMGENRTYAPRRRSELLSKGSNQIILSS